MLGGVRVGLTGALLTAALPALGAPYLTPEFGMDAPTRGPSLSGYAAASAFDGTNYFVVWEDARQSNRRIYGTRVSPTGQVLDPVGIALGNQLAAARAPAFA